MADKRRHPRQRADLDIFYYTEVRSGDGTSRVYYPGTIVDTSEQGLGILTSCPHQLEERLWFETLDKHRRPVAGHVRWVEGGGNRYRLGLELDG